MKTQFLPVFTQMSSMHRVFGDPVESTEIHPYPNTLGAPLLSRNGATIRVRSWHRISLITRQGCLVSRFECYYNGILVDYSRERSLIIKTFQWLAKMGHIHTAGIIDNAIKSVTA
jgi:hypothetical protein